MAPWPHSEEINTPRALLFAAALVVALTIPALSLSGKIPSRAAPPSLATMSRPPVVGQPYTGGTTYQRPMVLVESALRRTAAFGARYADWRDPSAVSLPVSSVANLTVFPSGLVALTSTLNRTSARRVAAQCLAVWDAAWTHVNASVATLASSAGLVSASVPPNTTLPCSGYSVLPAAGCARIVASAVAGSTATHYPGIEALYGTTVYGAMLRARSPNPQTDWFSESVGVSVSCWNTVSLAFNASGFALVQFDTPRDALTLQFSEFSMNGCSRLDRPFTCWSARIDITLCTDSCTCVFPPTPAPTTTPTTPPAPSPSPPPPPAQCLFTYRQASAWLTTLQRQPPVIFIDPYNSSRIITFDSWSPPASRPPWYRSPDHLRILLMTTIGAVTALLPETMDWPDAVVGQDTSNQALIVSEDGVSRYVSELGLANLTLRRDDPYIVLAVNVSEQPGSAWSANAQTSFVQSGLKRVVYSLGNRCRRVNEIVALSDAYGPGWHAAHVAYVNRHRKHATCGDHLATMYSSTLNDVYYVFTQLSWAEQSPVSYAPAGPYQGSSASVVQITIVNNNASLYINHIYAMDRQTGSVVHNVSSAVSSNVANVTWPMNITNGTLLVVLPMDQWHMYAWSVVVNEYAVPTVMTIPYTNAKFVLRPGRVNAPFNGIEPNTNVIIWAAYGNCTGSGNSLEAQNQIAAKSTPVPKQLYRVSYKGDHGHIRVGGRNIRFRNLVDAEMVEKARRKYRLASKSHVILELYGAATASCPDDEKPRKTQITVIYERDGVCTIIKSDKNRETAMQFDGEQWSTPMIVTLK